MDDIIVNQVSQILKVKAVSFSNSGLNNQILTKEPPLNFSSPNRTPSDSVTKNYSATQILTEFQLATDAKNVEIASSFLNKGYVPSKEDIEIIRRIIDNLPETTNATKVIDKAVNAKIRSLDINEPIVQEAISKDLNTEEIQKDFQKIKAEVLGDKSIPAKTKVEISNTIDRAKKEIEIINNSQNLKDAEYTIQDKLRNSVNQSVARKLQNIIEVTTKALVEIKGILENSLSNQIQQEPALQNSDALVNEIGQAKIKLTTDRQSLLNQIETQVNEWVALKETSQKIVELFKSGQNESLKDVADLINKKLPEFVKSLNSTDEIVAKFGEYISAFPLTDKSKQVVTPNIGDLTNVASGKILQAATQNTTIENEVPSGKESSAKGNPENPLTSVTTKDKNSEGVFQLLRPITEAATALKNNLETIKNTLNQTIELPPSIAVKDLIKIFQDKFPVFFKLFENQDFDNGDFPELKKIQDQLESSKIKPDVSSNAGNLKLNKEGESTPKTINLNLLQAEVENLENEHFKKNTTIQSFKKIHESVIKTEGKLELQHILEKSPNKSDSFHAFEIKLNPLQEMQPSRVEIYQNQKSEDPNSQESYSFNIEIELTQVGLVKANLFSSDNAKQIQVNFAKEEFAKIAIENQDELESQLEKIPFKSQLFFSSIPIATQNEKESTSNAITNNNGSLKLDSLA